MSTLRKARAVGKGKAGSGWRKRNPANTKLALSQVTHQKPWFQQLRTSKCGLCITSVRREGPEGAIRKGVASVLKEGGEIEGRKIKKRRRRKEEHTEYQREE